MKSELVSAVVCFALVITTTLLSPAIAENLYNKDGFRALTADRRARNIGDVLTVLIVENSSAAATAGAKTGMSNAKGIDISSPDKHRGYGLGLDESFEGSGKISRTGRLLAQLSVTVVGIDLNGDLKIKGEQLIEINGEKQVINLNGRVRPMDIGDNNSIASNRIADARITYIGDGVLAESQKKGWFSRVLSFLGLI